MNKILIIDDTKENLEAVKDSLEILIPDCLVITTESGKEGLKVAKDVQPDVIISDVFMPQMDGIEVCKRLKEDEATKHIPIIIHTGSKTDAEIRIQCLEAGADVFLAKPIDAGELTAQINAMLRIKKAEDKLRAEKEQLDDAVHKRTKELKESEENYRSIYQNMHIGIYRTTPEGEILLANPALIEILKYDSFEELKTRNLEQNGYYSNNSRKEFKEEISQNKQIRGFESTWIRADGKNVYVRENAKAFYDADGNIKYYEGTIEDITEYKKAEEAVKESEEALMLVIENIPFAVFAHNLDGEFILVNKTSTDYTGYTQKQLLKMRVSDVDHQSITRDFRKNIWEKLQYGGHDQVISTHYRKDGSQYPVEVHITAISLRNEPVIIAIVQDITERKQAEKTLAESEQLNRTVIENSPIGISVRDKNGTLLLSNEAWKTLWGSSGKDISADHQKRKKLVFDEKDSYLHEHLDEIRKVYSEGGQYFIQDIKLSRDKKKKAEWISQYFYSIKDEHGEVEKVVILTEDITERKRAEQIQIVFNNIAKAVNTTQNLDEFYHTIHQFLNTVIDVRNFYIALYDEDKETIFFPYYVDDKDTKPEPVPQKLSKGLTEYVIRTGKSLLAPKEYYMRLADEGKIEISGSISEVWIGTPLRIENKIIGVMAVQSYKDASVYNKKDLEILELISYEIAIAIEHKKMEQINLRLSEMIRNARDGIILTNPDSQITYVNPAYEKMSGYTLSELLNKDPADFIVTEDTAAIANEIRSAVKILGEWKGELYCIRKNEEVYPIDTRIFAIKNEKGELVEIAAIQQDITERKRAEEALQESEERFRAQYQGSPIPTFTWKGTGEDFVLVGYNNAAIAMTHEQSNKYLKKTAHEMYQNRHEILEDLHRCLTEKTIIRKELISQHFLPGKYTITNYAFVPPDLVMVHVIDITERKREEKIQKTLYDISNALNTTDNINELYSKIREFLRDVIDTTNFYIALYDEKTDMISLPFDVDEKDVYETFPAGKTITKYVIKTGKSLFATKDVVKKLIKKGLIETVGSPSEIWLGVPLKIENKVIGVIAVQSYDDPNLYTEKDIEILNFISEEIALAINRKQAEEELKVNRERLKIANSILRHDIANDFVVIKSALDIYREEHDKTMLDEIEKRVEKSLHTIKQQREQERFLDSHSDLNEYQIYNVIQEIIEDYPGIICTVTGTGKAYADNAIYSVFENIISNAKIHGKSTKLDIDISYNEDFCEIRFADDGIGIADEIKHKVFEKGFQFGENGHTGIGLYIVKKAVNDYGGEVFVEDNTPKGAVFVIRLKKTIAR